MRSPPHVMCAALLSALVMGCAEPLPPAASVLTQDDLAGGQYLAVSAGREHTCALAMDSTAVCWGSNEFLQLGVARGSTTCVPPDSDREIACELLPVHVTGGLHFSKIRAGGSVTCALAADRHVYCWGDNAHGQLGSPGPRETFTPTPVADSGLFADIAAGGNHACAVRTDQSVACWGANDFGQVGIASIGIGVAAPATVSTLIQFVSVTAGERRTCGVSVTAGAYCWGALWAGLDASGGDILRSQSRPAPVADAPPFVWLSAGLSSTCGVSDSSRVLCWQANHAGSFGTDSVVGSPTPIGAATELRFVRVSTGGRHTCAIATDTRAYCWGADDHGQLGVSPLFTVGQCDDVPCSILPQRVPGWRNFAEISAGLGDHTCALTDLHNVYCWGAGYFGQRGVGNRFDSAASTMVSPPAM